jgi:peptidoglycan hydrolase CwlO-like protein
MLQSLSKTLIVMTFSLIIMLIFTLPQPAQQIEPISELEERLHSLTDEESRQLKSLFTVVMELEKLTKEKEALMTEIDQVTDKLDQLKKQINLKDADFKANRNALRQVLRSYQRLGPASFIEIALQANSPADFIRRINILKDLVKNTDNLLSSLAKGKEQLLAEKEAHSKTLQQLDSIQERLNASLRETELLKKEIDKLLQSIGDKKQYYETQLNEMQAAWPTFKPFFADTLVKLSQIIEKGDLPQDAVRITITTKGIAGIITEETFNNVIAAHPDLPTVEFVFLPGEAIMKLPKDQLVLKGTFGIREKTAIVFEVAEGSFYGFPLSDEALEELFAASEPEIDFGPLIGNNRLQSLKLEDGQLRLVMLPSFLLK